MIAMSTTSANYRSREQADGSVGKEEVDPSRSPYGMHSPIIIPMFPHYKEACKAKDWEADHGKDCLGHLLPHCTGLWDFLGAPASAHGRWITWLKTSKENKCTGNLLASIKWGRCGHA